MEKGITVVEDSARIFGTAEPSGIIEKATKIANSLIPIIEKKKLYKVIGPKKHVYVEGWNTMLAMLGVFPSLAHSVRLDRCEEIAYSARVELRHTSGAVVGAGEALCSSHEANWKAKDEFQINSMAQTRATGKAARLSFSWIMNMAGYAEVPAEEMDTHENSDPIDPPKAKNHKDEAEAIAFGPFVPAVVSMKEGEGAKGKWRKYGIKAPDNSWLGTFDKTYGELAQSAKQNGKKIAGTYKKDGDYKTVVALEIAE